MDKLILDQNYSNALICAMYESKKLDYEPMDGTDNLLKDILKKYRRTAVKKKALTCALLYDGVELCSPCVQPKNELILATHNFQLDAFDLERCRYAIDIRDASLTNVSNFRDILSQDDDNFREYKQLKNKHRRLFKEMSHCFYDAACLLMLGDIEKAFHQIPSFLKMGLSDEEAIVRFVVELSEGNLSPLSASLLVYMMWVDEMTYMMKLSTDQEIPFITNNVDFSKVWGTNRNTVKDTLEVYDRCIVLMKQELPYIPQVKTFDDVLRLREKKELIRFKKVLNQWISLMSENEVDLANKMQADIIKANKELKRYCEYENRAETFFLWFSLATSFIPMIPGAVWWGVEQGVKKAIDYKIQQNSWIGLGNP